MAVTYYNNNPNRGLISVTVGDTWSDLLFSAVEFNADGTPFPGDLTGRTYKLQVRPDPRASRVYMTLESPENFILGQSLEALEYDVENDNPPGTTKDQLFVWARPEQTTIIPGQWYADLQETGPGENVVTKYSYVFEALTEVTR